MSIAVIMGLTASENRRQLNVYVIKSIDAYSRILTVGFVLDVDDFEFVDPHTSHTPLCFPSLRTIIRITVTITIRQRPVAGRVLCLNTFFLPTEMYSVPESEHRNDHTTLHRPATGNVLLTLTRARNGVCSHACALQILLRRRSCSERGCRHGRPPRLHLFTD